MAKRLGMSTRTLQRLLSDQGVAYTDLLDDLCIEFAKHHLRGSELSLCEIGYLVGFSEQSSFTRAFRRWTGKTPLEYRQALGEALDWGRCRQLHVGAWSKRKAATA